MITEETRLKMRQAKLGKKLPESQKQKISRALNGVKKSPEHIAKLSGKNSYAWAGDNVGYVGVHLWLRKTYGRASKCEHCAVLGKKYQWANISGNYLRSRDDFLELCVSCHKNYDMSAEQKYIFSQLSRGNTNQRKAVIRIEENGQTVEYVSAFHAAQDVGVVPSAINNCLKGLSKKSAGYKWKYKEITNAC